MRRRLRATAVALLAALCGAVGPGQPALAGAVVTVDSTLTDELAAYGDGGAPPHWVVGDCAWSVALPDGSARVAWFFCDSELATAGGDVGVNNLGLVQQGSAFTTFSGAGARPSYFPSPGPTDWYWVGDPTAWSAVPSRSRSTGGRRTWRPRTTRPASRTRAPAQPQTNCSPCATGTLSAYNAKEHPELESGGSLVLSTTSTARSPPTSSSTPSTTGPASST